MPVALTKPPEIKLPVEAGPVLRKPLLTLPVVLTVAAYTVPVPDTTPVPNNTLLAVTLPVVVTGPVRLTRLPVYVGKYAATLALLYDEPPPEIPVKNAPLPMK